MPRETSVPVAGPFHWERSLVRPREQAAQDVHVGQGGEAIWESVVTTMGGDRVGVTVMGCPKAIRVRSTASDAARHDAVVRHVAWRLAVEGNGDAIYARLEADPWMGPLAARWWGIRPMRDASPWVALARLILGQQVSVASHRTLVNRLLARWGYPTLTPSGSRVAAWPAPEVLAAQTVDGLVAGGIPRRPAATLKRVARWAADGGLVGSPAEVVRGLETIHGVGPWTTAGLRLFGWGDDDAVMASDLVLRSAAARVAQAAEPFTARELARWLEPYQPYRGWVSYLLWHERLEAGGTPAESGGVRS